MSRQFTVSRVFSDLDVSGVTTSETSAPLPIGQMRMLSVIANLASGTGTHDATVKVQVSNTPEHPERVAAEGVWIDLASGSVTLDSANVTKALIADSCYQWARLVYTKNGATGGTVNVDFHATAVGG